MMNMGLIFLFELLAVLAGPSWLRILMIMASFFVAIRIGEGKRLKAVLIACGLSLLPVALLIKNGNPKIEAPGLPDPSGLLAGFEPTNYFGPASLERVRGLLLSDSPKLGNLEATRLLDHVPLEDYQSMTLLNLDKAPVVWRGSFFYDNYSEMALNQNTLKYKDGRLFLTQIVPIPSVEETLGYLAIDALILSKNVHERPKSWLCLDEPQFAGLTPVVVGPEQNGLLNQLSEAMSLDAPPYDIHLIPDPASDPLVDRLTAIWALAFCTGLFILARTRQQKKAYLVHLGCLFLLSWPTMAHLDHLTSFGSYIFGYDRLGNLLATPFHLTITCTLAFLLVRALCRMFPDNYWMGLLVGPFIFVVCLGAPRFLQNANSFSYVHPLEAITSPGAFLSYFAFLAVFAYCALLFKYVPRTSLKVKFALLPVILAVTFFWRPEQLFGAGSLFLLWMMKDFRAHSALRAGLIVLVFYPYLVESERMQEIRFARDNILDEITLLVERNHFRMGRIIQRLPVLMEQLNGNPHDQMMEMFAKQAGLYEDEIDFALSLTDPNGESVSIASQHISLDGIPYLLGPENRITQFQDSENSPNLLIFRKSLDTESGKFDFVAILGNDYQNLSLIRRLRRVDPDKENQGNAPTGPYMAYILDVFNKNGRPLYNQREASHLNQDELTNILEKPHYWRLNGRNTVFLFKDRNYIFRITHKATPLRMLFARYLALFLVMTVIIQSARLSLRPGRGFLSRWRRSFALKLAGFMFLSSVLPTFTSGWLLINSIQRNQTREEESLAQSKIKAARNLFANVRPEMVEQGDRGTVWRSIQPAVWPVQENARILGEDLSLYISGSLSNTSQPEAFSRGVLDRRLDHDLVRKLLVGKSAYVLDRKPLPDGSSMLVAYTVIDQGSNRRGIIGMTMIPFSQRQKFRWWEQLEFSVSILFGLLFMMALLTRLFAQNYLRPVAAITRGAARMAKGLVIRPIRINRQDELDRMVAAFNIMQQRIQRSQARLRDQLDIQDETLKSMSSGLLGFSKTGRIILENNKLWELLRIDSERPVNLEDLIDLQPGFAGMKTLFDEGENGEVSFHVGGGGDERELLLKLRMVSTGNGHDIYCIAALEDITDALAAGRFKAWSEMARRVAHEIKNPLTPIQLEMDYLTRLYKDKRPGFEEALDDTAQQIGKQVQDLRRIATEFSDYARPVELEYGEANLANMLEDILDSYRKTMSGVNFSSHLDQEITAMVDERLLKRAINNLVLNAIQAMDEEGDLTLRLYKDADHIHIWVQDTGSGVPEEEHSRIFEAYFSTKDQGTGLGMGIAKRYVDLHGGQLSIDPSWTEGTRFRITLPLQNEERE